MFLGDYRNYSFIFKMVFQIFSLKYLFGIDSSEIVSTSSTIVFINYSNLILDLGLAQDQLNLNFRLKRFVIGVNFIFWISLIFIIPISVFFQLPLFIGSAVAFSGICRNYFIKNNNKKKLFLLDTIGSVLSLFCLWLFIIVFKSNFKYYYISFLPALIEFFLLTPIIFFIVRRIPVFQFKISFQNYLSKVLDIFTSNFDIILVNSFFSSTVASSYFQMKEIYRKGNQFFSILTLRLFFDKIGKIVNSRLMEFLIFLSFFFLVLEFKFSGSIIISAVIVSLVLNFIANFFVIHNSLKKYNISTILFFSLFFILISLTNIDPSILFVFIMLLLLISQLYEIRKV